MKSILIDNSRLIHTKVISLGLASANSILICIAFFKASGLQQIKVSLERALNKGAHIKIVIGLDFYLTEPKALWDLFNLIYQKKEKEYKNQSCMMLCNKDSKKTFHPKLYLWINEDVATLVVGSANLTGGGLAKNVELSVAHRLPRNSKLVNDALAFFAAIEKDPRVKCATPVRLSQYEREYDLYSKKMRKAREEAEQEIKNVSKFNLDRAKLEKYLLKYRKDKDSRPGWRKRQDDYKEARRLLDRLVTKKISSQKEFLDIYGRLVGNKGEGSLWHSGGLARHKPMIAKHHKEFQDMVRDVQIRIGEPASAVLPIALKYATKIRGLGLNVITEILNTFSPADFTVLNKNSASSLRFFGLADVGDLSKKSFPSERYERFNAVAKELANRYKFQNLSQVDHFLNYVYWRTKTKSSK